MDQHEPQRPDPDELLTLVNEKQRGKLKIFLVPALAWGKPMPCYKKLIDYVHKGWMWLSVW